MNIKCDGGRGDWVITKRREAREKTATRGREQGKKPNIRRKSGRYVGMGLAGAHPRPFGWDLGSSPLGGGGCHHPSMKR